MSNRVRKSIVIFLVSLGVIELAMAQQPSENSCTSSLSGELCRPLRTRILKLAPELDAAKPLAMVDEAGWTLASDLLVGGVQPNWVGAYQPRSETFAWWLRTEETLTAPIEAFGSWLVLPLRDGRILKVESKNGKVVWEARLSRFATSKPLVVGKTLIVATVDQKLYALDFQSGQTSWVYDAATAPGLPVRAAAPPVVVGNDVIWGTSEGDIRLVNLTSGKEVWKFDPGGTEVRFKDVVGEIGVGNRQVYIARFDGIVFAIDTERKPGDVIWKENFASITTSAYREGTLFVGCINGDVIALQASTGKQIWKTSLGASVKSITVSEKAIYIGGSQGRIAALTLNSGEMLWHDDLQGSVTRQPIVYDDQIIFATGLKVMYGYQML